MNLSPLLPVMANRLFVFDMDGTLLIRTTACIEIARISGTLEEMHVWEKKFASGEVDSFGFAQNLRKLWGVWTSRLSGGLLKPHPSSAT